MRWTATYGMGPTMSTAGGPNFRRRSTSFSPCSGGPPKHGTTPTSGAPSGPGRGPAEGGGAGRPRTGAGVGGELVRLVRADLPVEAEDLARLRRGVEHRAAQH